MEGFDLSPYFVTIFGALGPALAYVLTFFTKAYIDKIPKTVLPFIPMALGILLGIVESQAGAEGLAPIMVALWTMLAIVIQEVQQKLAQIISGGKSSSLLGLLTGNKVG